MSTPIRRYDAIVVGARPAGAATAMLLARGGQDVLVLDSARPGTDTLSTHALMRGAVVQLERWGLLPAVVAAGAPAITATEFCYGDDVETVAPRPGTTPLRAPRRTVLDPLLADAAQDAGAQVVFGARVTEVLRDERGTVTGVEYVERGTRTPVRAHAAVVVGADGRRSTVADAVGAPVEHAGTASSAVLYAYLPGLPRDRYRWCYRPGLTAGVIPTTGDEACVWVGVPTARFDALRGDLEGAHRALLAEAAPDLGDRLGGPDAGPRRVRGFPGVPGFVRRAGGPGWALVGDAGYFKDPLTAHGITDALRDAELLARALLGSSGPTRADALRDYQDTRDRLSADVAALTERIASYRWDLAELRELLPALSRAMRPEVDEIRGFDTAPTTETAA
ncbi:NAD(P)/FAD-dependent oxidoreductase [Actinomycetospora straminea]|uniref:NAD(P)/FAD-dependent oxidoreductase n=1 Tax=Actinomycetospora straminea TaxID=663607 RepID=A0ABP9EAF9_9PSEU|nr:NAD(P)/FAD-dependent oxidoreductase [Actinomycetospora straminea]MDD7931986.1 NAD(P)/FAD-dependent oxidoreductase [Actinomycetospora straminea]